FLPDTPSSNIYTLSLHDALPIYGCTVELAPAVVGEDDPVHTEVGERAGVLDRLDSLDRDLAGPQFADLLEIVVVDRRIHRGVEEFADGPAGVRQGRELEFRRGEEIEPPPRAGDRVRDRPQRDLRRDGEAVAGVAQARPGHRGVDG